MAQLFRFVLIRTQFADKTRTKSWRPVFFVQLLPMFPQLFVFLAESFVFRIQFAASLQQLVHLFD